MNNEFRLRIVLLAGAGGAGGERPNKERSAKTKIKDKAPEHVPSTNELALEERNSNTVPKTV